MKIFIGIFFLTFTLFSNSQINIKEAWHKVETQNNALKASRADIRHSELKQQSAEGMYLPSVSITGSYTHLNDPIGMDISDISDTVNPILQSIGGKGLPSEIDFLDQDILLVDLQVLYPLYMGGKIDAAQDAYAAKVAEAKAKQRMAEDKAFLQLVKLYYGLIMTESLYQTRAEAEKALKIHYTFAQKMKIQGQISTAELLNAKVKYDSAKIETTKARHKVDIVKSAFYQMIKAKQEPHSSLFISQKIGSRYKYTNESINHHAAIDVLNAKSRQSSALINIEKAAWQPKVLGYANVNLHKGDSMMEELAPAWMVGVGVKFDIFSRKDRAKEVEAAKVLHAKVASLKAQATEDLKIAVQKTYDELSLYRDEFNALSSSLALAKENYKLRNLAFKEGLSTSLEVVEAQTFLIAAKTQRLNAAYNYVKKLAELSVLSGDKNLFFTFEKSSKRIK